MENTYLCKLFAIAITAISGVRYGLMTMPVRPEFDHICTPQRRSSLTIHWYGSLLTSCARPKSPPSRCANVVEFGSSFTQRRKAEQDNKLCNESETTLLRCTDTSRSYLSLRLCVKQTGTIFWYYNPFIEIGNYPANWLSISFQCTTLSSSAFTGRRSSLPCARKSTGTMIQAPFAP
jgi:hypothetical protein